MTGYVSDGAELWAAAAWTRRGTHLVQLSGGPAVPRDGRPLRIAHFIGRCEPTTVNGVERVVRDLSEAQAALGHEVARVVLHPEDAGPEPARGRTARLLRGAASLLLRRGVPRLLREELLDWRPDVVHLHSLHVPENVLLASWLRRRRIPYCVTPHNAIAPAVLGRGRWRKAAFHLLYERRYLAGARFVHALTEGERRTLRTYGITRPIPVVPNGVAVAPLDEAGRTAARQALGMSGSGLVFVYVGRLDPHVKGLDLLLRAFAAARPAGATLCLVGPDWRGGEAWLRALSTSLGVDQSTVFAGPLFGDAKTRLLQAADVYVQVSRWEGVSLSVLEAAALARPCLLTEAADPGGAFGRAGAARVVPPDTDSIAAALRAFAAVDPRRLAFMGARARAVVEAGFSWPTVAAALVSAYRDEALR